MAEQALDAAFNQAAAGAAASTGEWAGLKAAAGEGRLRMERGVAEQCAAACDAAIDKLGDAQRALVQADRLEGLGAWGSGQALAKALADKARSDANSGHSCLTAHITVLGEMRDTFMAAAAAYRGAESSNAAAFGGAR